METKLQLDNARLHCTKLEEQLAEKDEYFTNREKEIQDHYKSEISKGNVHNNLNSFKLLLTNYFIFSGESTPRTRRTF